MNKGQRVRGLKGECWTREEVKDQGMGIRESR